MSTYGAWFNGKWPAYVASHAQRLQAQIDHYAPTITCEHCGGIGSREAFLDTLWWELVNGLYDTHGYTMESGEGDPCDIFAAQYKDISDGD